ncbi:MAG: sigma-70 family RNA polymerase sigma factor, partial [Mangrovibacterium sp.]
HDIIEEAELNARINQAINALPEKCRQVFVLCRFEGLKYKQIAGRLGISEKTVSMQMGIALRKMRKKLSDIQSFNFLLFLFF